MKKNHVSLRLPPRTVERLDKRARQANESRTELAARLLDEGLHTADYPLIVFRGEGADRRPALCGTRLDVWHVVETVRASSGSIEEAAKYLGISSTSVKTCVRYYAEFRDEVDTWGDRMRSIADDEEAAWRREQEALA